MSPGKIFQRVVFSIFVFAVLLASINLAFAKPVLPPNSDQSDDMDFEDFDEPEEDEEEEEDDHFDPCGDNNCEDDVSVDIDVTLEEINRAEAFVEALKDLKIDTSEIDNEINKLEDLIDQAKDTLSIFKDELGDNNFDQQILHEFWDILGEINQAASDQMSLIYDYLKTKIPKEAETLSKWSNWVEYGEDDALDIFKDFDLELGDMVLADYFQDMSTKFERDVFDKIKKNLKGGILDKMKKYVDDENVLEDFEEILRGIDIFGDEFTNEILQNQFSILDILDGISEEELKGARDGKKIRELMNQTKNIVIPDYFQEELNDEWMAIVEELAIDPTDQDENLLEEWIKEIEKTLNDIDQENIFGENAVEFFDVQMDDNPWYWRPVMSARRSGIINGYSNQDGMTGYFGPSDNVTYAQALKMALEANGHHMENSEEGPWYQNYLNELDILARARLNSKTFIDWDAPATRGDVILIINELFDIQPIKYVDGTFPDVKAEDSIADGSMAANLAGIFTGEGDTGNLNPNGNINRAGFAKAIGIAIDYKNHGNLADKLKSFQKKNLK